MGPRNVGRDAPAKGLRKNYEKPKHKNYEGSAVRWAYRSEVFYEMQFLYPGKTGVEYKAPWQRGPWVERAKGLRKTL